MKPSIHWVGGSHSDAIWQNLRHHLPNLGFPISALQTADVVCFSAGDPFWADPGHTNDLVLSVLNSKRRVIIVERHEYGWNNYANAELRNQNAWLGVPDYGRDTEASGGHHGDKHAPLAMLCREIEKDRLLYFRREYFRGFDYPSFVHPINFHLGPSPALVSFEDFRRRNLDLMCIWGETHDHRRIIANTLRKCIADGWLRADVRSPVYAGMAGRLGGGEAYRKPHEDARIFVTSDGHGLGGGREWELVTTAVMLRKRSWMILPHEFEPEVNCLQWGGANDPAPDELESMLLSWKDRLDDLYRIYAAGFHHAHKWHTAEARTLYVEEKMRARGWA